ncbi:MAG: hypothetical protein ACFFCI_08895 [Promethearchaeota archaeon]
MSADNIISKSESICFEDLNTDYYSLRIGEEIPRLEIKEIKKITNPQKQDNLPSVDYKYIIESVDNKILTVNSWVLWRAIKSALKKAGKIKATLELKHNGKDEYSVRAFRV